ncbi:MAG: uracil-DNA glycosylase [Candidatus Levybacteria bacterium]|nr:uracil-DNA glycosylase [Candidatus Levybacteria bacterium]
MDKQKRLDEIAREIEKCKVCKAGKSGKAVPGEGNPDAKVAFIGEAPGKTEALTGRPFVGRSGKLLRSMIVSIGFREEDVYITSPVKYLPDRGTPSSTDIKHGRAHLMEQLEIIKPKFVVLLGRVAAEGVLQTRISVMKEHGKIIEEKGGIKYFLTLHPAAAIRFQKNKPLLESDFKAIKKLL